MNRAKLKEFREETNGGINFPVVLTKIMPAKPRDNGNPAGVSALAESLKRTDAYLQAQNRLNELVLGKGVQS